MVMQANDDLILFLHKLMLIFNNPNLEIRLLPCYFIGLNLDSIKEQYRSSIWCIIWISFMDPPHRKKLTELISVTVSF